MGHNNNVETLYGPDQTHLQASMKHTGQFASALSMRAGEGAGTQHPPGDKGRKGVGVAGFREKPKV